jgi:hypothetical protein
MNAFKESNGKIDVPRYIRWCRQNMPKLQLIHVANATYLADEEEFKRELNSLLIKRKALKERRIETAQELNLRIKEEKKSGKRNKQGRVKDKTPAPPPPDGFQTVQALLNTPLPTELDAARKMQKQLLDFKTAKAKGYSSKASKDRLLDLQDLIDKLTPKPKPAPKPEPKPEPPSGA